MSVDNDKVSEHFYDRAFREILVASIFSNKINLQHHVWWACVLFNFQRFKECCSQWLQVSISSNSNASCPWNRSPGTKKILITRESIPIHIKNPIWQNDLSHWPAPWPSNPHFFTTTAYNCSLFISHCFISKPYRSYNMEF